MSKFNTFQSGCRTDSTPRFFALLIISILLTFSCKKECVDICSDYGLTLDKENCNCVCSNGLTAFEFNGYTYCIEESETHDIYILENYNPSAWILDDENHTTIPEILLSYVPKGIDSLESFFSQWPEELPFWIEWGYYIQPITFPWGSPFNTRSGGTFDIRKFINDTTPVALIQPVHHVFKQMNIEIDDELFNYNGWTSLGVIQFNENMDEMIFNYLGYKSPDHAGVAYYNLNGEEVLDFPYVPYHPPLDPYDPYHLQLIFSRLNFEQ